MSTDRSGIQGDVLVERRDADGNLIEQYRGKNLVTDVGDQLYAERGSGVASPALPTGMKLGTGGTAVAKTGAGAALVTYLSGSNHAFDSTYPQSAQPGGAGTARRIIYKTTYAAGEATTASAITEAVIITEVISSDTTSTIAETVARVLVTGISAKGASDTLTVTWNHDLLGA